MYLNQDYASSNCHLSPVVIGGVGGSGTRIVARLVRKLGFYLGDLKRDGSEDNLWFWQFFYFPVSDETIVTEYLQKLQHFSLSIFGHPLRIIKSNCQWILYLSSHEFHESIVRRSHVRSIIRDLFKYQRLKGLKTRDFMGWGWKEPVSQMYLEQLSYCFKGMRYIHVLRNGLDMLYSSNETMSREFKIWSSNFDIPVPEDQFSFRRALLQYWVKSNQKNISLAGKLLKSNFLLVRFEDLCHEPYHNILKIASFLGLKRNQLDVDELMQDIKVPRSIDRYKHHASIDFSRTEIKEVDAFLNKFNGKK